MIHPGSYNILIWFTSIPQHSYDISILFQDEILRDNAPKTTSKYLPKLIQKGDKNGAWDLPGSECETWPLIPLPQGDFWTPNEPQRVP